MGIRLIKGSRVNIQKDFPNLQKLSLFVGWHLDSKTDCDLDVSLFMLGSDHKILGEEYFVFYNNLKSPDGAVEYIDGNNAGGKILKIDLSLVNSAVEEIVVVASLDQSNYEVQSFNDLRDIYLKLFKNDGEEEIAEFFLNGAACSKESALEMLRLYRKDGGWRFQAIGSGYRRGLPEALKRYYDHYSEEQAPQQEASQPQAVDQTPELEAPTKVPKSQTPTTQHIRVGTQPLAPLSVSTTEQKKADIGKIGAIRRYIIFIHRAADLVKQAGLWQDQQDIHYDIWLHTLTFVATLVANNRSFTDAEYLFLKGLFYNAKADLKLVEEDISQLGLEFRDFKFYYAVPKYLSAFLELDRRAYYRVSIATLKSLEMIGLDVLKIDGKIDPVELEKLTSYLSYLRKFVASSGIDSEIVDVSLVDQEGEPEFLTEYLRPRRDPMIGTIVKGRYKVIKELGRGGIGVVYLAQDLQLLSKPVVIKILLRESLENEWTRTKFYHEVEALVRIEHPCIVAVLDAGETPDGQPFFVMQFVEGVTLRAMILNSPEGMDFTQVAGYVRQIGQALTAAHSSGVYHRDLKPENIMIQTLSGGERQVKIIDFGIARLDNSKVEENRSQGGLAGTPMYMSPEQIMQEEITGASDLYAFGVISYEMLTGRKPFNPKPGEGIFAFVTQLLMKQQSGPDRPPIQFRQDLPVAAQNSILKALSFNPKNRHTTAKEFGEELAQALTIR